ncbi:tyrosine-type recombinase/integrase [Burkholderia pseudomallei]|uniref:tyrosine-type recombinase/integrase n=1 Tax=Burkholderia pseudomallei TaxID=28450 RepID=UPI00294A4BFB|nr:tyrosine-type recombinase/integrase [Burkholderia pseudomallei]CAJ9608690.1 integrase family protein [Burkholderia pseudomallei]
MKAKISRELLRTAEPRKHAFDIQDTELRGFAVRVTPGGRITYCIRYTGVDGKQARKSLDRSFPATSVSDAREAARVLLGKIANGEDPAETARQKRRATMTLGEFIEERYRDWLATNSQTATATEKRIRAAFGDELARPLVEFNAWIIEKWRSARMKAGKAPATINRDLAALGSLFSRALEWGLVDAHPLGTVKQLQEPDGRIRWLSDDEEDRLRAALDTREARERAARTNANKWRAARRYELLPEIDESVYVDHLKPMVLLSLNTGLRQGETFQLRWDAVDLDLAVLTVRGATAKSRKVRHVPLNDEALAVLKQWRKQTPGEFVFPGRDGSHVTEIKTAWGKLLDQAKLTDFTWHDMRHHFASRLVMSGVDLNTVRELLGHADLTMTIRYAHLAPAHKALAVAKLLRPSARAFDESLSG